MLYFIETTKCDADDSPEYNFKECLTTHQFILPALYTDSFLLILCYICRLRNTLSWTEQTFLSFQFLGSHVLFLVTHSGKRQIIMLNLPYKYYSIQIHETHKNLSVVL